MAERTCSEQGCGETGDKRFGRGWYCEDHHAVRVTRAAHGKQGAKIAEAIAATGIGPYEERALRLVKVAHELDLRLAVRAETEFAIAEVEDLYRRTLGALARAEGLYA